ncbi:MAG: flavodoxin domain-containing protein [Actinomycetota bacterium]|nr:flavodoxin domain-containing protein [Actinomycetota bacterium]
MAGVLDGQNIGVERLGIDDVSDLTRYEAVVLGSAVYMGQWLEPARNFVQRHRDELAARQTWLFSSGPIGDPPRPKAEEAVKVEEIADATKTAGHRLFAGRIDKSKLSFPERAVIRAVGAKEGDYRDWDEIRGWAAQIAAQLRR